MAQDIDRSYWRHLPNFLSALRIALIPVIAWFTWNSYPLFAFAAFVAGALTDFLDGRLARAFNWRTHVGALLDLLADKLFVLSLMALLWFNETQVPLYAALVLLRYSAQLAVIAVLIGWKKIPFKVAPRLLPKAATAVAFLVLGTGFLQLVAINWLPETSELARLVSNAIKVFSLVGCALEAWVLAIFLPRYWMILRGRHDTFG